MNVENLYIAMRLKAIRDIALKILKKIEFELIKKQR